MVLFPELQCPLTPKPKGNFGTRANIVAGLPVGHYGTLKREKSEKPARPSDDTAIEASKLLKKGEKRTDFSSDVGRKKFGFSHEEIDDSDAYYEGQFKLFQRCGEGTLYSPETGTKYVGQFLNDQFHGYGDHVWSDESCYTGQWKNGKKDGFAEFLSADGLRYVGQWEEGRRHGQGMQEYANGDSFQGWWYYGLCSGMGAYQFADGARYEGTWATGHYDGPGILYTADGGRERHSYNCGRLETREVLPPGAPPKTGGHRVPLLRGGRKLLTQCHDITHKPTVLPKPQASKYLIRRETAGMVLTAPSIRPSTAPGNPFAEAGEFSEMPDRSRTVTPAAMASGAVKSDVDDK